MKTFTFINVLIYKASKENFVKRKFSLIDKINLNFNHLIIKFYENSINAHSKFYFIFSNH